jgi:hypothetical protein
VYVCVCLTEHYELFRVCLCVRAPSFFFCVCVLCGCGVCLIKKKRKKKEGVNGVVIEIRKCCVKGRRPDVQSFNFPFFISIHFPPSIILFSSSFSFSSPCSFPFRYFFYVAVRYSTDTRRSSFFTPPTETIRLSFDSSHAHTKSRQSSKTHENHIRHIFRYRQSVSVNRNFLSFFFLFFQHQTYYNSFGCHHLSFRCFVCVGESVSVCDCVRVIRVKV